MKIDTRDFGTLDLDEKECITFRSPIFGFDTLTRFALLSDDEAGEGLFWLQSVEDSSICFILLDPVGIGLEYKPELPGDVAELLEIKDEAIVQVIAVVPEDFKDTTVNLKSPIVINPQNKIAAQVILDADYPIRMRLFSEEGEKC